MFAQIMSLPTGHALMFSPTWSTSFSDKEGNGLLEGENKKERERDNVSIVHEVQIRLRVTSDAGMSRV